MSNQLPLQEICFSFGWQVFNTDQVPKERLSECLALLKNTRSNRIRSISGSEDTAVPCKTRGEERG